MLDPMTSRLAQVLYQERLQAAQAARQRRTRWVAIPGPIDRLRLAIGKQLISLGQRVQAAAVRREAKV